MKKLIHQSSITIVEENHDLYVNGILNSIADAFFSVNYEYCYTGFNELHASRMKDLYGVDVKLGDKLSDYQSTQIDWLKAKSFIDRALAGETFTEYVYLGDSGSKQLYSEISHSPILNSKNEVIGVSIFSKDVTERKAIEDALKANERKYRDLVDNSPDAIAIYCDDKVVFVNKACFKLIGASARQELIGKPVLDFIHPEFKEFAISRMKEAFINRKVLPLINERFIKLDGSFVDVEVKSIPIIFDGKHAVQLIIHDITELKQAEEKIRETEILFSQAFKASPAAMTIATQKDGSYIAVNENFLRIAELDRKDVIGKKPEELDLMDEDTRKRLKDQLIETGILTDIEVQAKSASGKSLVLTISVEITELAGEHCILATMQDITERKKIEKALRESEEKFKKAFTTSPDSININRLEDGVYVSINEGFTRIMGYTEDEILGKSSVDKNIWVDSTDRDKLVAELKEKGFAKNLVTQFRTKSGKYVSGMMSATVLELDGVKHVLNITRDIDKLKQAERALQESEEKLSTLFSSMTEMVAMHELVFDEDGNAINYRITDCNSAYTQILGIKKEDAIGKLATEVYQCESAPYLEIYSKVAITNESYEFNTFYAPSDKFFLISVVSTKKNCFSTITADITNIQRIQELITDKNKELESYLYVASHDLRSPLINIQGFSQRLQKQSEEIKAILGGSKSESEKKVGIDKITNEGMPKTLDFILSNVSKMDTLIKSLLQISRTGRLMLVVKKIDMNQLINKIVAAHNYQIIELSAQVIIQNLDYCYGDENQLNQLFSNIIDNALKYHDPNKLLKIEISSEVQYNRVQYAISDTGIGISPRNIEKIWDVFYRADHTLSQSGEGIGLSIAKRITNKHNGKIWVESVEGKGSTFFIELQKQDFFEL